LLPFIKKNCVLPSVKNTDWRESMNDQEKHWLVREKTIRLLWRGGIAMLFLLVMADFFIHAHPYFQIDGTFGFFSWFALVTCISMVLFAKALGLLLKRKDTYYDNE
tara:strand:+ start:29 stop:346 length:318 start_codon:yes stop_codon:yes gene_type:complete